MNSVPATRINVSIRITLDPVRKSLVAMSKNASILQHPSSTFTKCTHIKHISELTSGNWRGAHGSRFCSPLKGMAVSVPCSRICHIAFLVIWRKSDPVGSEKAICNTSNLSCSRLESVDKGREIRFRSPSAGVSVSRISEPYAPVLRMYDNVIY